MASAEAADPVAPTIQERDEFDERLRFFSNFLHRNRPEWEKKIDKELANGRYRIPLELNDVQKDEAAASDLARRVLASPVKYLLPWEEALINFLKDINEKQVNTLRYPLKLDLRGSFGRQRVTPRGMTSHTLQHLMCVEGIVTKCGVSEPKIIQSIYSRKNDDGHVESKDQRDATSFVESTTAGANPTTDSEGFDLLMEVGLSAYKDQQKFMLQEAPEHAPPGQIPRSVEVMCDGDLVDKTKPGDRVQVIGVFRGFPGQLREFTTGIWPTRIIATSVMPVKEMDDAPFVTQDITNIKEIARRDDAFSLLARSFAPSICGHDKVKKGLLLQLIGGTEKNLPNGTHLRGDINVLMVGDPSCGKSQMLRFVMNTAPLAISTTGRGSSGVGLTAAMLRDPGSKDFTIEAGAMVLADRGVICIDEFDKMGQADRVALHEAMEQQVVTIAKAGMHVTLNARCSVVAAANPVYGNFDPKMDLAKNINMPDSLLSRFDLVYVVRDLTDETIDKKIATQVLNQCRYRHTGFSRRRGVEQQHSSIIERRAQVEAERSMEATEVFQKKVGDSGEGAQVLTVDFLRKYIKYCKRFAPVLSEEAHEEISERYVEMRRLFQTGYTDTREPGTEQKPRLAVTTRTLEALIRLSTAHAKLKLRKDEVLREDVREAHRLMLLAREEEKEEEATPIGEDGGDDGEGGGEDGGSGPGSGRGVKRGAEDGEEGAPPGKAPGGVGITAARYRVLETLVSRTFARVSDLLNLAQGDLLEEVNRELVSGEDLFTKAEFVAGIQRMEDANKVLVTDDGSVARIS